MSGGGEWRGEWPSVDALLGATVDAAKKGDQEAAWNLIGLFAKCERTQVPEPLFRYVADEFARQLSRPPATIGQDLMDTVVSLCLTHDSADKAIQARGKEVIRTRYMSNSPGAFFGLTGRPDKVGKETRGAPSKSPAVDSARALAVRGIKAIEKVTRHKAIAIASKRLGVDASTLRKIMDASETRQAESWQEMEEWAFTCKEKAAADGEAAQAAWAAAGNPGTPGCLAVVLAREYGNNPAGAVLWVDPRRAAWIKEHGYAAQVSHTEAEAAELRRLHMARTTVATRARAVAEPRFKWGEQYGIILLRRE